MEHLEEEDTKLILLGDYVHRGSDGRGVMERIMELQYRYGQEKVIALLGNHDEWVVEGVSSIDYMNDMIGEKPEEDDDRYLSERMNNGIINIKKRKINMDVAKRITELREEAGENRKEFSVHTGIPVRTLEDWEAGRRTPPEYRNAAHVCDGSIMIQRCCFPEPKIYEKLKKLPSGKKKLITKRIPVDVDYSKMIADGLIEIQNCSNCWHTTDGEKHIDNMALHILFYLFKKYAEEGKLSEYISYNV